MDTIARRDGVHRRPAPLRTILIALAAALCVTLLPATPAEAADARTAGEIRNRVEYLINRDRARHGLRRLRVSSRMQFYATDHAARMSSAGTIFHDVSGLTYEVLRSATAWGENVGMTASTDAARAAHRMFMNSPGHRANVLHRRWTHMGIGIVKRNGTTYIVERFADGT